MSFTYTLALARSLPVEWIALRSFTRINLSLACKYWARVEVTGSGKHSSYSNTELITAVKKRFIGTGLKWSKPSIASTLRLFLQQVRLKNNNWKHFIKLQLIRKNPKESAVCNVLVLEKINKLWLMPKIGTTVYLVMIW